jgi:hypothetical protein
MSGRADTCLLADCKWDKNRVILTLTSPYNARDTPHVCAKLRKELSKDTVQASKQAGRKRQAQSGTAKPKRSVRTKH